MKLVKCQFFYDFYALLESFIKIFMAIFKVFKFYKSLTVVSSISNPY